MKALISLLTDFGISDPFVAEMKAVIFSICPGVTVVDISHTVEKFNIRGGAFVLSSATPYFPSGTVHVAVVDPGVGSERRPIALETNRSLFVGPDNGLLILAAAREGIRHVYELTNRSLMAEAISSTFHGRDIFASVAAHLASGTPPREAGPEITDYVKLLFAEPEFNRRGVNCEILYIDGFGNIVTNISRKRLAKLNPNRGLALRNRGRHLPLRFVKTYSELCEKELGCLVGSHGFIEIVYRQESAARRLNARIGDDLRITVLLGTTENS